MSDKTARRFLPELALIAATVAYGATFKLVQNALDDVTPVGFILLRFAVGGAVLLPFALQRGWRRPGVDDASARDFVRGVVLFGVAGFGGYWFQNLGLERTTTSNSAFITGLFVVFTPLIETGVTRHRPANNVLAAVAVAVVGLFFLEGGTFDLHSGDALTLGCAFMFAIWIVLGSRLSPRFDPVALTTGQLFVLAALAVPVVIVGGLGHITAAVVIAVLVTGIACSAVAFTLQLWGQRYVEPSRAAVILEFEPVVAGVVGFFVGERLGVAGYVGALVILAGIVIAESGTLDRAVKRGRESSRADAAKPRMAQRGSRVVVTEQSKPRAAFAPWDRRELPGLFSVEESARRVGHYKWTEMRLFEALGGWVATVPELDVKMVLGRHTYHHAWHAELWHKRLPELREMNQERLNVPPNDAYVAFMDAVREPEAAEETIEKLVGVYRVLIPRKIGVYTYHLNGTSTITDAPTIRSLKFALQDEFDDWREGEMLLQSLIDTPEKVERAARRQAELERLYIASGGVAGPGSLGASVDSAEEVAVG